MTDEVLIMEAPAATAPDRSLDAGDERDEILGMQAAVKEIYVDPLIKQYIVAWSTRRASTRPSTSAPRRAARWRSSAAQARALLDGRDFVYPTT